MTYEDKIIDEYTANKKDNYTKNKIIDNLDKGLYGKDSSKKLRDNLSVESVMILSKNQTEAIKIDWWTPSHHKNRIEFFNEHGSVSSNWFLISDIYDYIEYMHGRFENELYSEIIYQLFKNMDLIKDYTVDFTENNIMFTIKINDVNNIRLSILSKNKAKTSDFMISYNDGDFSENRNVEKIFNRLKEDVDEALKYINEFSMKYKLHALDYHDKFNLTIKREYFILRYDIFNSMWIVSSETYPFPSPIRKFNTNTIHKLVEDMNKYFSNILKQAEYDDIFNKIKYIIMDNFKDKFENITSQNIKIYGIKQDLYKLCLQLDKDYILEVNPYDFYNNEIIYLELKIESKNNYKTFSQEITKLNWYKLINKIFDDNTNYVTFSNMDSTFKINQYYANKMIVPLIKFICDDFQVQKADVITKMQSPIRQINFKIIELNDKSNILGQTEKDNTLTVTLPYDNKIIFTDLTNDIIGMKFISSNPYVFKPFKILTTNVDNSEIKLDVLLTNLKEIITQTNENYSVQHKELNTEYVKSLAFNNSVETLLITKGGIKKIRKVLHLPKLQGDGAMKEWTLFERTIGKIEKLNIPNTPKFLDKGKTDSTIWYEYSYIEGESLRDLIGGQTLRVSRRNFITDIIKQLLVIQDSLIKNGIIHRDIKPSNVIIDNNNVVHLIDFNTIKTDNKGSGTTSILSWGYTPIREILLCNDKTDIYSIGVIWYEMLTNTDVVELAMKNKPLDLDKIEEDNIRNIISNMITDDYDKRWDTKKILSEIENPQVTQKVKSKPNYVLIGVLIIFIGSLIISIMTQHPIPIVTSIVSFLHLIITAEWNKPSNSIIKFLQEDNNSVVNNLSLINKVTQSSKTENNIIIGDNNYGVNINVGSNATQSIINNDSRWSNKTLLIEYLTRNKISGYRIDESDMFNLKVIVNSSVVLTDSMDLDVVPAIFKVVNGSFDTSKLYPKVDVINLPDVLNGTLKMNKMQKISHRSTTHNGKTIF